MNVGCFLWTPSVAPPWDKVLMTFVAALPCSSCISSFSFHLHCTGLLSLPGNLLASSSLGAFAPAVPTPWSLLPTPSHGPFYLSFRYTLPLYTLCAPSTLSY